MAPGEGEARRTFCGLAGWLTEVPNTLLTLEAVELPTSPQIDGVTCKKCQALLKKSASGDAGAQSTNPSCSPIQPKSANQARRP